MAVSRQRRSVAYGVGSPLQFIPTQPISSTRDPVTGDFAELGTIWANKSTNAAWVLASIVSNSATWTPMTVNAGATITTGNLTVTAGDINVTVGDVVLAGGSLDVDQDISVTSGDITVIAGDILVTAGDIDVATGTIEAESDITSVAGDIVATTGDILGRSLFAGGDEGTGAATTTTFTNGTDLGVSTGEGKVLLTTANPGDSIGWIKIYVGTDIRFIPIWADIAP